MSPKAERITIEGDDQAPDLVRGEVTRLSPAEVACTAPPKPGARPGEHRDTLLAAVWARVQERLLFHGAKSERDACRQLMQGVPGKSLDSVFTAGVNEQKAEQIPAPLRPRGPGRNGDTISIDGTVDGAEMLRKLYKEAKRLMARSAADSPFMQVIERHRASWSRWRPDPASVEALRTMHAQEIRSASMQNRRADLSAWRKKFDQVMTPPEDADTGRA